jgi:TatD DNase family protein
MVETDAPYLAPVPMRGKRNQPAFVAHTLACVAELRGDDVAALDAATTATAARVFGW